MHIVHVAAENDSLPGAKVGGVADVVRDIAPALADLGHQVTVLVPSYGFLHRLAGARWQSDIRFLFRGTEHRAQLYSVPPGSFHENVFHYVIHHPMITAVHAETGAHQIYVHDPADQPFYSDGSRFACFSSAVAAVLAQELIAPVDVIHLHDWHSAAVALLRRYHRSCAPLRRIRTVFTIHNVAMQGVRPLRDSHSSLEAWFPEMAYQWLDVSDPRWPDTCNLMACGIRMADAVHTVSPTYAHEICRPSAPPHYYGAEGLEGVINAASEQGRLVGILNGCTYGKKHPVARMDPLEMIRELAQQIIKWCARHQSVPATHFIARHTLSALPRRFTGRQMMLSSVTRLTRQKVQILVHGAGNGLSVLEQILMELGDHGFYCLLGTGETPLERYFTRVSAQFPNFIFLNGFSDHCAEMLYANGDLFLMPSSFEPCGISQMLAMRDGQPCVVHAVGGLRNTVLDNVNGFCFQGNDLNQQAKGCITATARAIHMFRNDRGRWRDIRNAAAGARFSWPDTAHQYIRKLYIP